MGRKKWSVSRFKTHENGRSFGPAGKYRFETKLAARLIWILCRIEAVKTGHRPWLSYIPTYSIDTTDIGIDFADAGPWRSYQLETSGDTFDQMVQNATVSEIDQDGGTLSAYGLDEASSQIEAACLRLILDKIGHQCDQCDSHFETGSGRLGEDGSFCDKCDRTNMIQGALDAGIPMSVIMGRTKLSDHFSERYINAQCGKPSHDET